MSTTGKHDVEPTALERLIEARLSRRDVLAVALRGVASVLGAALGSVARAQPAAVSTLRFAEIAHARSDTHIVPPGYRAQVLLRWGDPLFRDAPPFAPGRFDAAAQEKQFGYNNDFLAFMPLPRGSRTAGHGLLFVNHEYCLPHLMWPQKSDRRYLERMTAPECSHEMAAHGASIVEIRRHGNDWRVAVDSPHTRRITTHATRMRIDGPAAGHRRMRTSADPQGTLVTGMLSNCAGGVTPWGTVLTCEENFFGYFLGAIDRHPESAVLRRYSFGSQLWYAWGRHFTRFDLDKEPNEPNRFGWVVEIDPYDPRSMPVKHTALGRLLHEGATTAVSHDGRIAVYMGDDASFEYLYKFVTSAKLVPDDPRANRGLLARGTLYVARFEATGKMRWLPLEHGQGPLSRANGFGSQADVVIEARRAADLVGATSMDRPEGVETNPLTGRVYVALTNNRQRGAEQTNAANPRAGNRWGQIIEIVPPQVDGVADHTATECDWEFFLIAGDPSDPAQSARYLGPVSANGWLACPDNVAFDPRGRVWIATDGQGATAGFSDSLYAADTSGPARGITRLFFNGPRGAEITGPCFAPDGRTLFLSVQHPANEAGSTFEKPSTRWPDFKDDTPPRPSVLAIRRDDGGQIGG